MPRQKQTLIAHLVFGICLQKEWNWDLLVFLSTPSVVKLRKFSFFSLSLAHGVINKLHWTQYQHTEAESELLVQFTGKKDLSVYYTRADDDDDYPVRDGDQMIESKKRTFNPINERRFHH